MINIFIKNIEEVSLVKYEKFLLTLPIEMQKEVLKYVQKEDKERTLMGKMLLLDYLEKNTCFNLYSIRRTEYHKPYIPNSDICFNISHSGKYVIFACTFSNVIGIDIEEMNPNIDIDDFKTVLSEDEYIGIENAKEPLAPFYTLWTKKEALLKAEGKGFFDDVRAIRIKEDKIIFKDREYFTFSSKLDNYIFSLVYFKKEEIKIFSSFKNLG
jgi:4'-phosphopantetheinyl transferase